jgi:hypothetical protein
MGRLAADHGAFSAAAGQQVTLNLPGTTGIDVPFDLTDPNGSDGFTNQTTKSFRDSHPWGSTSWRSPGRCVESK